MKKIFSILITLVLALPVFAKAALPQNKIITGQVSQLVSSRVVVKTGSGQSYAADIGTARLFRKNGSPMQRAEIVVGDKVEVSGTLYGDGSFLAFTLRNLSLYAHSWTFSGKVLSVNPAQNVFSLQNSQQGEVTVKTDSLTTYQIQNSSQAGLMGLKPDMTATIKGVWERSRKEVVAKDVKAKMRLVNIEFMGTVFMTVPGGVTVAVGSTLYGVDISGTKFYDKSGKAIQFTQIALGDKVKVSGKHPSGSLQVIAQSVKKY